MFWGQNIMQLFSADAKIKKNIFAPENIKKRLGGWLWASFEGGFFMFTGSKIYFLFFWKH